MAQIDELQDQIAALEATISGTSGMVAAFDGELARMRDSLVFTGREVNTLSTGLGSGLRRAFDGLVFDGMKLSDALKGIGQTLSNTVYGIAMKPVQNALGGALAQGLNGLMGNMMPYAKGGVVSQATPFGMRGGMGVMGEAGPEAIMPLSRGPDGKLGVQAAGGGRPVTVVMNISTPDVQGFQRSQTQIAAQAQRMLARGQKNR